MFEPSSNKKSYQWLNAQRCFSEIMTGLTCPNLTNAKNKPQIICARPMNVPPSSDSDNKTQDSLEKGKCAIIKTGSSINLVVPIGIEIGNYTTLIKRSSFSSTNCSSQFIEMYVKVKGGTVSIVTIFPSQFDEYKKNFF